MALGGCFHLMEFEFEFVVYFGRGARVLKSGLIFANPLINRPIRALLIALSRPPPCYSTQHDSLSDVWL